MMVNYCINKYIGLMKNTWQTEFETPFESSVLEDNIARLAGADRDEDVYDNSGPLCKV